MGTAVKVNKAQVFKEIEETLGLVPSWLKQAPEAALGSYWGLMRDFYLAETVIPNKYKELIGLAVSGATHCKYCTLFHTEGARLAGASDAEIAEANAMASMTMMASTFVNGQQIDFDAFREETRQIVGYVKKQIAKQQVKQPETHA